MKGATYLSTKIERAGQVIGPFVVQEDTGKRTRRGEIIWELFDTRTGEVVHRRSYRVIRLAKQYGSPVPGQRMTVTEVTT